MVYYPSVLGLGVWFIYRELREHGPSYLLMVRLLWIGVDNRRFPSRLAMFTFGTFKMGDAHPSGGAIGRRFIVFQICFIQQPGGFAFGAFVGNRFGCFIVFQDAQDIGPRIAGGLDVVNGFLDNLHDAGRANLSNQQRQLVQMARLGDSRCADAPVDG